MPPKKEKNTEPEKKPKAKLKNQDIDEKLAKKLAAMAKIMDKHGGGQFASTETKIKYTPTGLPVFDNEVIGIGGLPQGKIVEVYGVKSSGKTALALHLGAATQKQDPYATVKLYDIERAWTDPWGRSMGLDFDRLARPRITTAEAVSDQICEDLASETPPDVIILDSIAVITPEGVSSKAVRQESMHDNYARSTFLTRFFNKIVGGFWFPFVNSKGERPKDAKFVCLGDTPTCILCINHAKVKTKQVGGRTITEWGHVGGVSLDFHACMQFMVTRIGFEKKGSTVTDQIIKVTADKNKLAPPKRTCEIKLSFKGGMEQMGTVDYLTMAVDKGLATVKGPWIQSALLPNGKTQGKDSFNKWVEETPEVKDMFV